MKKLLLPMMVLAAAVTTAVAQAIEVDYIPKVGEGGNAEGRVLWSSLNAGNAHLYAVIAMLDAPWGDQYVKPTNDFYLNPIDADGNFSINITTGGSGDFNITNVIFYVVEKSVFNGVAGGTVKKGNMTGRYLEMLSVSRVTWWANQVPEPTPGVAPGFVAAGTTVSLSCTAGDTIRYTTNGTVPTASSTAYAAPFAVPPSGSLIIHAAAFRAGGASSRTASFVYLPRTVQDKPFFGLNVSLILGDEYPGAALSESATRTRMQPLAPLTHWVRTFGTINNGHEHINKIAKNELGMKTLVGVWVENDTLANTAQLNGLRAILAQGPAPDLLAVGNESGLQGIPAAVLAGMVDSVRGILAEHGLGASVPVGSVDIGGWNWSRTVMGKLDFVGVNIYCGTWDNTAQSQMATATAQLYASEAQRFANKMILLTETGTPYAGGTYSVDYGSQTASQAKATAYLGAMLDWSYNASIPLFYFSAYDEAWKSRSGGHVIEQYFGLLGVNGVMHTFYEPTVRDFLRTQGSPVRVPYIWLYNYRGWHGITDYELLAMGQGANGCFVWESYVAGLDPANAASKFLITNFTVNAGSGVTSLKWTPDLGSARAYKVEGKTNLWDIGWHFPTNSGTRFFRVNVDLLP